MDSRIYDCVIDKTDILLADKNTRMKKQKQ